MENINKYNTTIIMKAKILPGPGIEHWPVDFSAGMLPLHHAGSNTREGQHLTCCYKNDNAIYGIFRILKMAVISISGEKL